MLAVHAAADAIECTLRDERLDLVVANRNSPNQSVLSGATTEIDRAAKLFSQRSMRSTKLPVAAAFHSRFIAHAERPFKEALERIQFQISKLPVFANQLEPALPDRSGGGASDSRGSIGAAGQFRSRNRQHVRVGRPHVPRGRPWQRAHEIGRIDARKSAEKPGRRCRFPGLIDRQALGHR